ncbi:MAG: tetratricopeptide repeat protein, partial [Candidatus Muirbacterium halophilum]|nr:tetratricopeptide repeat protein [Candidatus Muirbacterium halophilum]
AREIFTNVNTYYPNSGMNSKSDIGIADSYKDEENYEEAEKYYIKVIEDPFYNNFGKIYHQEKIRAYQELVEIYKKTDNYSKADEMLKKVLGAYYDSGYYYNDDFVKKAKEIYINTIKVQIEPVIEEMKEGVKKRLTASLVYKDGNPVNMSGLENIQWNWSITGNNDDSYTIEPVRNNSTQADFTLYKGNFMDIIVTAKVDFSVAEKRWVRLNSAGVKESSAQTRVVSREFSIEGDNQVPITIVNEDDRRIKRIPLVDGSKIKGVKAGLIEDINYPLFALIKSTNGYRKNTIDRIELEFIDPEDKVNKKIYLTETGEDTRIFKDGIYELSLLYPLPVNTIPTVVSMRKDQSEKGYINYFKKLEKDILSGEGLELSCINSSDADGDFLLININIKDKVINDYRQEDLIPEDSLFYIKIIDYKRTGIDEIEGLLEHFDKKFTAKEILPGIFMTEGFIMMKNVGEEDIITDNDGKKFYELHKGKFEVLDVSDLKDKKLESLDIKLVSDNKIYKKTVNSKIALGIFGFYESGKVHDISSIKENAKEFLTYMVNVASWGFHSGMDLSLSDSEFDYIRTSTQEIGILYYNGHGGTVEVKSNGIPLYLKNKINMDWSKDTYELPTIQMFKDIDENMIKENFDDIVPGLSMYVSPNQLGKFGYIDYESPNQGFYEKEVSLIFFEACLIGRNLEFMHAYFNSKCSIGYKTKVDENESKAISEVFFREFNKPDEDGEYRTVKEILEDITITIFDLKDQGIKYEPEIKDSKCPLYIINPDFRFPDLFEIEEEYEK